MAALAASLAGTVYVPVDTTQPEARRARILADAGVRAVLTQSWLPAPADAGDGEAPAPAAITVDEVPAGPAPSDPLPRAVEPRDPAYVIYTSGSTGAPKGVVVSHRSALNTLDGVDGLLDVGPGDRVLALAALGFDLSVYDLFGVLARGGAVVVPDAARRGDPSHWAELLEEHGVTLWNSVPAQAGMLADYLDSAPDCAPSALRALLLSGDWIPLALPGRLRGLLPGARLYSLGGATEGSIWSIHHPVGTVDPSWPSVPYGRPLPNQTFHVLDAAGRDRPDWVPGELHIGGEGVALGYLGDPERTAERFVDHPRTGERLYRTGDLGRYRPSGDLEFLGREDDQVKIRGHRVELAEVEAAVASHPAVAGVAVLAPEEREGRRLTAFVETAARAADADRSVPAPVADAARRAAAAEVGELDRAELSAFLDRMRTTALEAMTLTLTGAGLFPAAGSSHPEAEVLAALRADRRHHRLVRRWLAALVDAGRLRRAADGSLAGLTPVTAAEHAAGWDRLAELEARVRYGTDVLRYLRECAGRLPELLTAELDVRSLLFPGEGTDAASGAYRDNLAIRHLNAAVAAALAALAGERTADRPLRVLEVGAGTGGTTEAVVAALAGHPVEYLFTDVSPFFLTEARERFAAFPWISFGLYDIERTAAEQGRSPHSFDAVVAANVLHDAVDADAALARLREVLVPGGHLLAIETTLEHDPALMVSMEFMEGLDGGHHDARTSADQTFLTRAQWLEALAGAGAVGTVALPEDDPGLERTGQGLFLARLKADRLPAEPQDLARHAAARLPEYMVPARWQVLDRIPLTGNGKVDRKRLLAELPAAGADAGVGAVAAAPADELERALAGLWSELLDRPGVGREDDFFDLGGDSLLVARMVGRLGEVLPGTGEDIEWEVVLRHLLRTPTVAGLAAYLRDLSGQVEAAADRARDPYVPLSGPGGGAVTALVHAGTGTLVPYRSLITEIRRRAAGRGTVVGLELPDVAAFLDADPSSVIVRWAADYARALLERGGDRFHVVGYCLGGLVATEVARSLTEAGAEVASLTAISTHRPPFRLEDELISEYAFAVMMGIDPVAVGFPADEERVSAASDALLEATPGVLPDGAIGLLDGEFADVAERFRVLAATPRSERVERLCSALPPSAGTYAPEALEEMFRIFRQSVFSISRYEPAPYAGDVAFLRHSGAYPFPGNKESVTSYWERLVLGDLRVRDVPGDHFGMLSAPYAPGILQHLEAITGGDVVA
ncbi:amino acid adenylation domain-containing protein [Rothia sp. AR01]|uniref:Amino acid adenylation domain-containing protein n=1 Tax=Rothia santali TaxID=2949643 RepID=A0A9X2KHA4_9MICC|nr:amino acid adenylation domain-containing protein [Rothia santali]MCP3424660.1 amino acid adenylation domain-containing protein [Rothia santali]